MSTLIFVVSSARRTFWREALAHLFDFKVRLMPRFFSSHRQCEKPTKKIKIKIKIIIVIFRSVIKLIHAYNKNIFSTSTSSLATI